MIEPFRVKIMLYRELLIFLIYFFQREMYYKSLTSKGKRWQNIR